MNLISYLVLATIISFISIKLIIKIKERNKKSQLPLLFVFITPALIYYSQTLITSEVMTNPMSESSSITSVYPLSSN